MLGGCFCFCSVLILKSFSVLFLFLFFFFKLNFEQFWPTLTLSVVSPSPYPLVFKQIVRFSFCFLLVFLFVCLFVCLFYRACMINKNQKTQL